MVLKTYAFDPAQFLTDPQSQAELLQDAMDTGDATYLAHAKTTIARAKARLAGSKEAQTNTDQP